MVDCSFHLNNNSMSFFKMGAASFPAFSGMNQHINRAQSHCISNEGPIPRGTYYIIDRQSGGFLGPIRDWLSDNDEWFALYAIDSNIDDETFCDQVKRGQFRLHPKGPLGISKGCITIENWSDFQVIRSFLKSANTKKIPNTDIDCYGKVKVW